MNAPRYPADAVLFDLDGTLLDTIADLADGVNGMLAELGRPVRPAEEIHGFVGKGIADLVRRSLTENAHASEAQIDAALPVFRRHYALVNGRNATIYPGVRKTLDALRAQGRRLAVVTNKMEAFTRPLLQRMGLADLFDAVVSGDTLPTRKPEPEMVLHACALLNVEPARALMIGDSVNDSLAARAAGVPVLLVRYGYSEGMPVDAIDCDGLLSNALETLDHLCPR